jgi:hypothetical protein
MPIMSTYAKIIITVQRKEIDDILSIVPDTDTDGYNVVFNQFSIKNKTDCYISNSMLANYLQQFFETLLCDSELPHHIQIDCPMFPSVLLPPSYIKAYFPLLEKQIDTIQDDWPFETY